jgi:membrane-associated phospholipid phosphatase
VNLWWLVVAAVGLLILSLSIAAARHPSISPAEARVFHAVNRLPDGLYPILWLPMQLGNLIVGTAVGLGIALLQGDIGIAVGVVLAMVLKVVVERIVRHRMEAFLSVRQRPGTSEEGAILRGDVPKSGPSFPSGHIILVAAVGTVIAPAMPSVWWWAPLLAVILVMVGRVYVGAHNPLDVTAGLGAGLLLGGAVAAVIG